MKGGKFSNSPQLRKVLGRMGKVPLDFVDQEVGPGRGAGPGVPAQHVAEVDGVDGDVDRNGRGGGEQTVT